MFLGIRIFDNVVLWTTEQLYIFILLRKFLLIVIVNFKKCPKQKYFRESFFISSLLTTTAFTNSLEIWPWATFVVEEIVLEMLFCSFAIIRIEIWHVDQLVVVSNSNWKLIEGEHINCILKY